MIAETEFSEHKEVRDYICDEYKLSSANFLAIAFPQQGDEKVKEMLEDKTSIIQTMNLIFTTEKLLINSLYTRESMTWNSIIRIDLKDDSIVIVSNEAKHKINMNNKNNIKIINAILHMASKNDGQYVNLTGVENLRIPIRTPTET